MRMTVTMTSQPHCTNPCMPGHPDTHTGRARACEQHMITPSWMIGIVVLNSNIVIVNLYYKLNFWEDDPVER